MDPRQPDELFPWLARFVSAFGGAVCHSVDVTEEGLLSFRMGSGSRESVVTWSPGGGSGSGVPCGGGALRAEPEHGAEALSQVLRALQRLFVGGALPLLERRNREMRELSLDESLAERLAGELLSPGRTRCGPFVLDGVERVEGTAHLCFVSGDETTRVRVSPGEARPGAPAIVVDLAETAEPLGPDRRRLLGFVRYVVALSTRPEVRCIVPPESAPSPAQAPDRRAPRGDKDNPFLYDTANNSGLLMSAIFRATGRLASVFHADRECAGFASYLTSPVETVHLPQFGLRPRRRFLQTMRITDTGEMDAIMTGCEAEVEEMIRLVAGHDEPQLIFALGTCVAKVVGDDMVATVRRAGREGVPTIALETTLNDREDNFKLLWQRLVEEFQGQSGCPREGVLAVNLIGHGEPRSPAMVELRELLGLRGVDVAACIHPTFDLDELERLCEAQVNFILPSEAIREAFEWAEPRCVAATVEVPAPYGFRGTERWLEAILSYLELPLPPSGWLAEQRSAAAKGWERLKERARRHRVALAITENHFGSRYPESRGPVPWLALLAEMGFGLDVFVLATGDPSTDAARRARERELLERALEGATDLSVVEVSDRSELLESIRSSRAELVYSEVWRDRRVTSAGKIPISFVDFEPGLTGAVSSLRRLLSLCATPFFARYASFLEAPEGPLR